MDNKAESSLPLPNEDNITPPPPSPDPQTPLQAQNTSEMNTEELVESPAEVAAVAEQQDIASSSSSSQDQTTEVAVNAGTKYSLVVSDSSEVLPEVVSITKLPMEIIEKVFIMYIEDKCPLLCSLFETGCLPVNSEEEGLHVNSTFIQHKIKRERASLLPLLRLSSYFYGIISGLLSRQNAYISGVRSLQCFNLFARRRAAKFLVIPRLPYIESMFRKEGEPFIPALHGRGPMFPDDGEHYQDTSPMKYYSWDHAGTGTEWRVCRQGGENWKPKGWEMFPSWLTGGSRASGEYLFDDVAGNDGFDDPPSFVEQLKSLVVSPDFHTWLMDQPLVYGFNEDEIYPDLNFTGPSRHLMFKIFDSLRTNSQLEKLVISGNILRNACWLAPKAVGEFHPLSRLTHLTLSLSENPSQQDSPLVRLQKYIETPYDCHVCNLLTGRNGDNGATAEVPFLATLKHLHLRGPGAHACKNLFNANWKALDNVVIELGTHRGICDGDILKLFYAVDNTAYNRLQMTIDITVRLCEPEFEKQHFGHHWWRLYPEAFPTVKTIEQTNGTGEILALVKKLPGPEPPVYPAPEELVRLEYMIEREMDQAIMAVQQIWATDGIDPLTMTYMEEGPWREAELEELHRPDVTKEDPVFYEQERIVELRGRADYDWLKSDEPGCPRYWLQD